ncbi:thioredoxin family protein [Jiulongibacter sediminis]|jgi:peroxiredoxin|uniref:thioredoxin family protein n=1 Tax=Jiulongibacter sediminis TaxID=1605367 RepID=UPI0026F2A68B|nr:thioredoxin family protein [Jiulongibacter sediminis]
MALTESNMLPIGTKAPDFILPDTVSGQKVSLDELKSNVATVVMFICNHCKYVKHINGELVKIVEKFQEKGVSFIGISSNDIENFPEDAPEEMKKKAAELGYTFPYLYDESQEVAKAYDAACTPDFYIFDKDLKLVYRGRMDGSSPGNGVPITGTDLRGALRAVVAGDFVSEIQYPSMGCNIKWKG